MSENIYFQYKLYYFYSQLHFAKLQENHNIQLTLSYTKQLRFPKDEEITSKSNGTSI